MKTKKNKKWLATVLAVSILLSCLTLNVCAADMTEDELSTKSITLDSIMEGSEQYAQYYGGSYLDNGELVVLLTDANSTITSFVEDTIKMKPRYQKCNASLRELKTIKQEIEDILLNYSPGINRKKNELVESIAVMGTHVDKNAIFVGIVGCNDKKISQFKRYISDSEYIIFENFEGIYDHDMSGQPVDSDSDVLDTESVIITAVVVFVVGAIAFFFISKRRRNNDKTDKETDLT